MAEVDEQLGEMYLSDIEPLREELMVSTPRQLVCVTTLYQSCMPFSRQLFVAP